MALRRERRTLDSVAASMPKVASLAFTHIPHSLTASSQANPFRRMQQLSWRCATSVHGKRNAPLPPGWHRISDMDSRWVNLPGLVGMRFLFGITLLLSALAACPARADECEAKAAEIAAKIGLDAGARGADNSIALSARGDDD